MLHNCLRNWLWWHVRLDSKKSCSCLRLCVCVCIRRYTSICMLDLCKCTSASQCLCSWLTCPFVILCHSTSTPDWSTTVSAGGMTSWAPGGLLACVWFVCMSTSACYFGVLPGMFFFFFLSEEYIHVVYRVHTHTHLEAYKSQFLPLSM